MVGDQLAGRVEAGAQIMCCDRAETAVMDIVLARPHHLHRHRPLRALRHEHGIDDKSLIVIAAPSESAAKQRIVELYFLSRDTERSRRRGLSRRRILRPAPNFGGIAGGRHRCDRVQRLHLRVIGVVTAIFRFDRGCGRRQRGFRVTLLVPFNSRLLEIAGIGSERVQTFVAVESPGLSAAPPGYPGFKRGLGVKRSPRRFCEDADAIGQTHDIDNASNGFGRGIVDRVRRAAFDRAVHNRAINHPGHLDVDRIYRAAVNLGRQLDAHDVVADQPEVAGFLQCLRLDVGRDGWNLGKRDDFTIADAPARFCMNDDARFRAQFG